MTTIGEEFSDGIGKCKCGSTNLVVEQTAYIFINRDNGLNIVSEIEGDECDTLITCRDCEKEVK